MCHFTSSGYENLSLVIEQNDWIVVAKLKSKQEPANKIITAIQDGILKPPPNAPSKWKILNQYGRSNPWKNVNPTSRSACKAMSHM
jgi:hypothetical protein